ncbi:unnamed protein product [Ectocarpus sp. 4 AP-2014]
MQHGRRDKNDVFVGNIPFGTTEEQLHEIFSEAGGIVSIRLVLDFETGKPKGFAFVEYEDAATALSAIRNLNGYDCNGRLLRVNFSNNSSLGAEQQRGEKAPQQERTVKGVVMQMGIYEVWDIVSNMKQLVEKEPDKAKQMFVSHPQVAEALLHMQVRLGMFKAEDVPSLFIKAEEDVRLLGSFSSHQLIQLWGGVRQYNSQSRRSRSWPSSHHHHHHRSNYSSSRSSSNNNRCQCYSRLNHRAAGARPSTQQQRSSHGTRGADGTIDNNIACFRCIASGTFVRPSHVGCS